MESHSVGFNKDFSAMKKIGRKEAKAIGQKYYWTGKPCPREHVTFRLVSSSACCHCEKLRLKTYKAKKMTGENGLKQSESLRKSEKIREDIELKKATCSYEDYDV